PPVTLVRSSAEHFRAVARLDGTFNARRAALTHKFLLAHPHLWEDELPADPLWRTLVAPLERERAAALDRLRADLARPPGLIQQALSGLAPALTYGVLTARPSHPTRPHRPAGVTGGR